MDLSEQLKRLDTQEDYVRKVLMAHRVRRSRVISQEERKGQYKKGDVLLIVLVFIASLGSAVWAFFKMPQWFGDGSMDGLFQFLLSAPVALLGWALLIPLCSLGSNKAGNFKSVGFLVNGYNAWRKRDMMLLPEEAAEVAQWCMEKSELTQACKAWALQSPELPIAQREYKALERAFNLLKYIDKERTRCQEKIQQLDQTQKALNEFGLMDELQAHSQAHQLGQTTPQAQSSGSRRI